MRRILIAFSLLCAAGAWAAPKPKASPTPAEPTGFGRAKFGMSVAQVRKLYPALRLAPPNAGAPHFQDPSLSRFLLINTHVRGLPAPVHVELQFWKDRLWEVIVYYGGNLENEVAEDLARRYGTPNGVSAEWRLPHTTLTLDPQGGWYAMADNALAAEVRAAFIRSVQQNAPPPPAATPPPTARPDHP